MSGYCKIAPFHPIHHDYHETEYGFPEQAEHRLFERLALEIMQAGLSWEIVLKKRKRLNLSFDRFSVDKVAAYKAKDVSRLMRDEGIIRNRLKILAIIENAKTIQNLRESHNGFKGWMKAHHPQQKSSWIKLFKQEFRFTGGEIVGEFLMSTGYLPFAHAEDCAIYKKILKKRPAWLDAIEKGFVYDKIK